MKYAVLYYSETGNTEKVAKWIYGAINSDEKALVNIRSDSCIPDADLYFVGFPIHKQNCNMKIVDLLEQIEQGSIVLFATCGMQPTEKYRKKLEDSITLWLSDDVEYLGMFLCQGRTTEEQKAAFGDALPEYRGKLIEMLKSGDYHPDENDHEEAVRYVQEFLQYQY
jgi:flavodoxin